MAEITKFDYIGCEALKNITNISVYNEHTNECNTVFISGKDSISPLAIYKIGHTNNIYDGPIYDQHLLNINIRTISTYEKFLAIVPINLFEVYLLKINGKTEGKIDLKIWNSDGNTYENIKDYILNPIFALQPKCNATCFQLMQVIFIKSDVYYFVQSTCKHNKGHILFVLRGTIINNNNNSNGNYSSSRISLSPNIKVQSFYNLYKAGKMAKLSKKQSKNIMFGGATFDKVNTFAILLIYGDINSSESYEFTNGFIVKIRNYEYLDGLSTKFEFATNVTNELLTFDNEKPRGISYISNNNYFIITNNKNNNLVKYFVVKL